MQKLQSTFSLEGLGLTEDWSGAADAGGASDIGVSGNGALEDEGQGEPTVADLTATERSKAADETNCAWGLRRS